LFKSAWNKSKGFLIKVVTIMFAMSVVIWALSSFNFNGFTEDINNSFLASLGKIIAPLFKPLGFKDWKISVALLTGLSAKEIVVNTLNILYSNIYTTLPTVFTGVTAYTFLVFAYQFILAWVVAFMVNTIGGVIFMNGSIFELLIGGVIVAVALFILYKNLKSAKSGKGGCSGCSGCPSASQGCQSEKVKEKN